MKTPRAGARSQTLLAEAPNALNEQRLTILKLGHEFGVPAAELLDWAKTAEEWLVGAFAPEIVAPKRKKLHPGRRNGGNSSVRG